MKNFLSNLMLAVVWAFATEKFTVANLMVGLILGFCILWFAQRALGPSPYFTKVSQTIRLVLFYAWEMTLANLRLAYEVVTPLHHMRPGIIAVPLEAKTDAEITLVANLITLTPGSLCVDVSPDRRLLYVHLMYIDEDPEVTKRRLKEKIERRVLQVLR